MRANQNGKATSDKKTKNAPTTNNSLVLIEPYRLWTIKILNRFNIIGKDELASLLEQYLDSVNKAKAKISVDTEKESDLYLVGLEPTKWKDQDHYLVLGLQHLRHLATDEDIRRAHRRKALKHHPDKRGRANVDLESDYYACITRAMEILGDHVKRRSFDSVDPTFDDTIPARLKPKKLDSFYETFGPAFELNARWSSKPNTPHLGNENSTQDYVERFYEFWYNFQSWRDFSYLDEEDKDKGENRDERRWLDKQNKAARLQRKKEENIRIRTLTDNAYSCDPRIVKFKEDAKRRKAEEKKAKQEEIRSRYAREAAAQVENEKQKLEEEAKKEEEEKKKKIEEKKQRENAKKQAKKTIKSVQELCRSFDYFVIDPNETVKHIEELDKLLWILPHKKVIEFKEKLERAEDKRRVFLDNIGRLEEKFEEEKRETLSLIFGKQPTNGTDDKVSSGPLKSTEWTAGDVNLLVKAVNLFPAGTKDRWEVIAKYLCIHSSQQRDAKQVISKVKQIQEQVSKRRY